MTESQLVDDKANEITAIIEGKKMKVFCQGAFDIINAGHCRILRELKEKFGYVIVGLNSDQLMMDYKGRMIIPFAQRKEILESLKYVDEVIKCDDPDALTYLKSLQVDAFASAPEWLDKQADAIKFIEEQGGEFYPLTYYPDRGEILSSTQIRERVIMGAR